MRNKILFPYMLLFFTACLGQQKITWKDLAEVNFTEKYFEDYEDIFLYPEFLAPVKALEGKSVTIKGYFLNIAPEESIYVLSQGPMSACFFCNASGPETVMELQFESKPPFKTDNIIEVTGILKLNSDDIEHFNYILTNCEGVLQKYR